MLDVKTWLDLLEIWWAQALVGIFAGGVAYLAARIIVGQLKNKASKTRNLFDDAVVEALERPIHYGILTCIVIYVMFIVQVQFEVKLLPKASHLYVIVLSVFFSWFVMRLIRIREHQILNGEVKTKADQTTITAIFKLLRISVITITCLVVFQTLGLSVSGIIAFGGVGGAAVAFSAKDLLANFFGGLMVYLDKPFAVGDWVRSPDRNIEGTVENIGWRVTRIRTFDKRPLYVPNSVFTQVSIENPSRMSHRRIYETIGVRYGDFAQVQTICDNIETFLQGHDEIDESQTLMVNFNTFADSSLEFFIYCFTHTTNWEAFHSIKQEVLFKVGEIINNEGAEIAFPSRSIYMENNVPLQNVDRNDVERAQHKSQSGKLLKSDESGHTEHKGRSVSKNGPDVGESDGNN